MRKSTLIVSAVMAAFICLEMVGTARAVLVPVINLASNNATVQPAGPRAGAAGKDFFNIEGSSNGAFSSFGVADFTLPPVAVPVGFHVTGAVGVTLQLTQVNAAFSAPGPISVYLSTQNGVSIESTNTSLNYVSPNNGAASVDSDLGALTLLGTGAYTGSAATPNGTQDFFALTLSPAASSTFVNALRVGGTVRLAVTPDTAGVAGTYAGFSNLQQAGPTLAMFAVVNPIPEPASIIMLGLGGLAVVAGARYSRRSALQK